MYVQYRSSFPVGSNQFEYANRIWKTHDSPKEVFPFINSYKHLFNIYWILPMCQYSLILDTRDIAMDKTNISPSLYFSESQLGISMSSIIHNGFFKFLYHRWLAKKSSLLLLELVLLETIPTIAFSWHNGSLNHCLTTTTKRKPRS